MRVVDLYTYLPSERVQSTLGSELSSAVAIASLNQPACSKRGQDLTQLRVLSVTFFEQALV